MTIVCPLEKCVCVMQSDGNSFGEDVVYVKTVQDDISAKTVPI